MPDTLIVAEKPAVARDIARVIGATSGGQGWLRGNGYTVTWAIGHLVALPEPGEIDPEWKAWRIAALPMLPAKWPLKVLDGTKAQFQIVKKLLKECDEVICATDAGREGELIFRYIYEAAKCKKPTRRLWISSLTPDAIRAGLQALKPGTHYDPLADAARARSRADWLVGMNLSRAYALTYGDRYFVGRVQTPTLALVVARDREILAFKPEDYLELEATFGLDDATYPGTYLGEEKELQAARSDAPARSETASRPKEKRLPPDGALAEAIIARVKAGSARVRSNEARTLRLAPPLLYNLTELQRHANRLYGFSAARTLELAQALYERHKLLSYPRTDSNHLSVAVAATLPGIVAAIAAPYADKLREGTGQRPLGPRYVDDAKVSDHHAIIPTASRGHQAPLAGDERKIYDLVCRRLLSLWQGEYVTEVTTVLTEARGEAGTIDVFRTQGTVVVEPGWKALDIGFGKSEGDASGPLLPKGLTKDRPVDVEDVKALKKTTRPPPHLTDSALLAAMESAGKNLEDKELMLAMRDSGLGTPATRAAIIETLLARGYLERQGKSLKATPLGMRLVDAVHPSVKSAELTARWERELAEIQRGKRTLKAFMEALEEEIRSRVAEVVEGKGDAGNGTRSPVTSRAVAPAPAELPQARPDAGPSASTPRMTRNTQGISLSVRRDLSSLLTSRFGFSSFRPHQEDVCRAVVAGKDVLLVMPTGAGKSLCYQLPGLARGGTTLVVSPLVALIDDQVEKLRRMGLAAERIHSGRSREESRAVCHAYLAGQLDYLFIAPERLAVPGFPEMLRKRPLALIAIDEAHCISHWGHDFRPDYRLLGERLHWLRPAPVIALTATATPLVQDDIARQLALSAELRSIHGFRRTNIAIQVAELAPGERPHAIAAILKGKDRLPAIVYASTRKNAESLRDDLRSQFRAEAYHAGMRPDARDRVQTQYLDGKLDVIVATIAFGMGIDKADVRTVIHAALPSSVEGYYQEIGRAGRDGKPSRAILFHSFADRKTHEFLFDKGYPEPAVLRLIHRSLSDAPVPKATLQTKCKSLDDETFERALEKLWIHKGALVDPEENVALGDADWETPYREQRDHRRGQLRQMIELTETRRCRMLYFISHFGDTQDAGEPCGICDICRPEAAEGLVPRRVASEAEQRVAARLMQMVSSRSGYPAGRLHQDFLAAGGAIERRDFETIVSALVARGWLEVKQDTFKKDGETISFRKLSITQAGLDAPAEALADLAISGGEAAPGKGKGRKRKAGRKRRERAIATPVDSPWLLDALKKWRLAEAKRKGVPAFRVMTDAVLRAICEAQPQTHADLMDVKGLGPSLVARYGGTVLEIVRGHEGR